MLMPALSKAKARANGLHCQSNLKQFGNAFQCYLNDYEGYFPRSIWPGGWYCEGVIPPYIDEDYGSVWKCPNDNDDTITLFSYSYNEALMYTKMSQKKTPTQTFLLLEAERSCMDPLQTPDAYARFRHLTGMNILYIDGHVAWEKFFTFPTLYKDPFWGR
jgi:prepilin-type processing-associated H-X9-DG protein